MKLPLMPKYRCKRPQSLRYSCCIRKNIENVRRNHHDICPLSIRVGIHPTLFGCLPLQYVCVIFFINYKELPMRHAITAVYENGVFIPRSKVTLPEHTTVKIPIPALSTKKMPRKSPAVLFDLAPGGTTTDGSINHDAYLYGEAPR